MRFSRKKALWLLPTVFLVLILIQVKYFKPLSNPKKSILSPVTSQMSTVNNESESNLFEDEWNNTSKCQWDKSHKFLWRDFVNTGTSWNTMPRDYQICLSTQTSVEHLFWLAHHSEFWGGPVSVAVYVPGSDYNVAVHMIICLQRCFMKVRDLISFHFLYPSHLPPKFHEYTFNINLFNCKEPENYNRFLVDSFRNRDFKEILINTPYPQNLLRNIARANCPCLYAITPDIDMIPVEGMFQDFNRFLLRSEVQKCVKCAYIIPVYEMNTTVATFPRNKSELLIYVGKRLARPFHIQVYKPNQENSDLKHWESLSTNESFQVGYNITNYRNNWEPVYVAEAKDIPAFDERFIGYGNTRNSQIFEMQLMGYKWKMLTNTFLLHRGFQTMANYSPQRKSQKKKNEKKVKAFRKEKQIQYKVISKKYPRLPSPLNKALPLEKIEVQMRK